MIAFIAADARVHRSSGSNPILSIGADSTIAPLFAVALLRLAAPDSSPTTCPWWRRPRVVTGLLVAAVGLLQPGLARGLPLAAHRGRLHGRHRRDHHRAPAAARARRRVGRRVGGVAPRLGSLHHLGHVSAWSVVIALGTLVRDGRRRADQPALADGAGGGRRRDALCRGARRCRATACERARVGQRGAARVAPALARRCTSGASSSRPR